MSCLWKIISNMSMPVREVRGVNSFYKRLSLFLFLLVFIPVVSFAQLTGGTISATRCQLWNLRSITETVAITGQNLGEPIFYYWERSQSSDMSGFQQFLGGQILNNNTLALTGTWYFRRRVENDGQIAYSNIIPIVMMPTVNITGTLTVCENATNPTLTITAVGGVAPYTITYNLNGVPQTAIATTTGAGTMTGTVTISAPTNVAGTFTYSLTSVVDANSLSETCTNSSVSSSATITVTALPTATITANTLTACHNTASTTPTITITGAGGTAPYTFTYSLDGIPQTPITSTGTTATITPPISAVGNFVYQLISVQESSATACVNSQTSSVTITVNANPTVSSIEPATPVVCFSQATSFNVSFIGVTANPDQYRIVWSAGALAAGFTNDGFQAYNGTTNTITVPVPSNAAVGSYSGTLRLLNSSTGCYLENSAGAIVAPLPTATITSSTLSVCINESTLPTITVTATGATSPYTVTYNVTTNGVTVSNLTIITNLSGVAILSAPTSSAATIIYQLVSVQSSTTNCINAQNASVTVTVNALPSATITPSGVTTFCAGGSVTLNANTGSTLSYLWSDASTASSISSIVTSGTYSVTVTNTSTGCFATSTATTVTVNALPAATITPSGATTFCAGGSVTLNANTGGTLSYLWNDASTASSISNIVNSGTYSVTVTNTSTGCFATSTATTVTVNALPAATITPSGVTTFCAGGSVTLNANTGGTLSYLWSDASTASSISNIVTSGTYSVTVTNTGTGCFATSTSTTVTVNALPAATITPSGVTTFCAGGSVTLNANTGGTLSYLWSDASTASSISNIVTSGTYSVTVTNTSTGCFATSTSTTITVNALPAATITPSGVTTFCAGGSVTLNANTGGTLSYLWSDASTASSISNIVTSGTYSVTVTNTSTGCFATSTATTVTVNALPAATITPSGVTTFCAGGSVTLNANTGGTLSYLWSDASTASSISNIVTSGTYSVTVTNTSTGCFTTSTATTVTVNALPAATITPSGVTTFCAGGSVNLTSSTGASYLWSNAATGASISNITTSGTYTVTVTDGNGCKNTSSPTIVTVNALPAATITPSGATTFCAGGTVNLTSSTGTSYLWSNAATGSSISNITASGTYTVTVTDGNGCKNTSSPTIVTVNSLPVAIITPSGATTFCAGGTVNLTSSTGASYLWSNAATGASISNITTSGTYTVTVTDGNGCKNTSSPTVVTVNALPTATITPSGATTFCAGGTVNLTSSTGTSYLWSNAATGLSISNITTSGTYTVTVTDGNGCKNTSSPTIVTVNALPIATITPSGPVTFCAGGSVNLTSSTGTNYLWSNASTNASITNITTAGTYSVTVRDANGCQNTSAPVTITVNANPTLSITNPAAICSPGTVDLTAAAITTGSTGGLNYTYWSNAAATTALTTPFAIGTAGTYYIRGTNTITNCAVMQPVLVSINPQAVMQVNTPAAVCAPQTVDLTAAAITSGSAAGLSYTYFTNAAATTILNNANAVNSSGVYYIKGMPTSGCSAVVPVTVTIHPLPTLVVNNPAAVCSPQVINLTSANITAGSSAGLSFAYFSNASLTTPVANAQSVNSSGTFYIRATDATTGCVKALPVTVQINAAPQGVLATPPGNIICENSALTLNASGGNSYQWLFNQQPINGATAASYNATVAGNYAVRFISAQGCETVSANTISLELLSTPTVQFTLGNACAGVSTNFNNTSVTSASGGINWLWDFGDGSSSNQFSPSHIYSSAGTYSVRLTATSPVCSSFNETSVVTYRVQSALPAMRYKEVEVLKDIPVTVTARAIGTSFLWQPPAGVSNIRIASPSIRVSTTTEYTVAITNDIGCTTTDTVLVKVIPGVDIYVPQGFTPNNDGQNDRLYPILVGMRQLNYFRVFNRWGHMIFTTKESTIQSGWNGLYLGVLQPMGTYTWIAEAIDLQGNVVRKTGTVLLLQ